MSTEEMGMNILLDTAEKVYSERGRIAGEAYLRSLWKLESESGLQTLEKIVDLLHYVADMAEMESR